MNPQQREEFNRIQHNQSYTDYTEKRFCCGGDYCEGDHMGFIEAFIDKTVNQAREEEKNRINEQFCAFMHVIRGSSGKNQLSKIAQVMVAFRRSLITPTTN